jgi:hypothetical protein
LSGGQFGGGQAVPVNGGAQTAIATTTINPTSTTTYVISCQNVGNYSNSDTANTTVKVGVGGAGECEINPNGPGCPQ